MNSITSRRTRLTYRVLSAFIAFTFSFTSVVPPSCAQSISSLNLPVPGVMVTPSQAFVPVLLKGMTIRPDNPLQFEFIIDSGNTNFKEDQIKAESERLVKYFLASMTIPKDDLWVNLSPYESDKIIPEELGKTELGRDMLAQDYILKQLTASLMYPEKELGKEFWTKVYQKAQEKYGTTEIPVDTFNKVWILPEKATVYEHGQTVYIVDAELKVMLDSDYLAMNSNVGAPLVGARDKAGTSPAPTDHNLSVSTEIIREIILPEIEREVNYGKNFAPLRQIYHSLILAKWYKETIKNSLLSKIYIDQKKIAGVNLNDATLKDQIYAQYMEAYKKGVFNYIKEDYDRLSRETIPRKYFSGGIDKLTNIALTHSSSPIKESDNPKFHAEVGISPQVQSSESNDQFGPRGYEDLDNIGRNFLKKIATELGLNIEEITAPAEDEARKYLDGKLSIDWAPQYNGKLLVLRNVTETNENGEKLLVARQIGSLIFIRKDIYLSLSKELQNTIKDNAIVLRNFGLHFMYGQYSEAIIHDLMNYEVDKFHWIDVGSGYGILSIALLKLGAPFVHLFEKDPHAIEETRQLLHLNGYEEGKNFLIHEGSLEYHKMAYVENESKAIAERAKNIAIGIVSNIGNWRDYSITNGMSMSFIRYLPTAKLFFGSGYKFQWDGNHYHEMDEINAEIVASDKSALESYGFKVHQAPMYFPGTGYIVSIGASLNGMFDPALGDKEERKGTAPPSSINQSNPSTSLEAGPSDTPQSSSPLIDSAQRPVVPLSGTPFGRSGQKLAIDEIRNTSDEVGGIDMNAIDLDRQGAGVDIQFDPAELQELIDAGIDGFAPVIINITPLPSVLPLLGLDPANKEEHLEVTSLN